MNKNYSKFFGLKTYVLPKFSSVELSADLVALSAGTPTIGQNDDPWDLGDNNTRKYNYWKESELEWN